MKQHVKKFVNTYNGTLHEVMNKKTMQHFHSLFTILFKFYYISFLSKWDIHVFPEDIFNLKSTRTLKCSYIYSLLMFKIDLTR